jgi:hypothetical protein
MIHAYAKVRLKTGNIARIVEVLEQGKMYIGEVIGKNGKVSVESVEQNEIATVFEEIEHPLESLAQ